LPQKSNIFEANKLINRLKMYNWQQKNWPNFEFDDTIIDNLSMQLALELGEVKGLIDSLSKEVKEETILQIMISEAIQTSAIEGEYYSRQDVMSSIKKNIGISENLSLIKDKNALAIGKLMVEVRNAKNNNVCEALLKKWHAILMKYASSINAGKYRVGSESMQIISGTFGREIVHFEAPPSNTIASEMEQFINWYQKFTVEPTEIKKALLKTAIAHLYFETIHPFEDGNGRIGRALAEKCFSECINRPIVISISSTIEQNKKEYYASLKKAQRSLEITDWIFYFSKILLQSHKNAKQIIQFTLQKVNFFDKHKNVINERQHKAILKMFEAGIAGFEGGITSKKYVSINKTSRATATRDLQDLFEKQIIKQKGEGRSVSYDLNI
jgi:Fic family protein